MPEFDERQLGAVRKFLVSHFDEEELQTLCFELGVHFSSLPGQGKGGKARDLVAYFFRRGRMADLLGKLKAERSEQFDKAGMEAPVEEELASLFPEELIRDTPYPIAVAVARCNAARSEAERFKALDRLLNNVVYYLTTITLSQYWQDNPERGQLRAWLRGLSHSHLMTALNILNEIADHYGAGRETSFLSPLLFEPYTARLGEASPLARAYWAMEEHLPPDAAPATGPVTPRSYLIRLLQVREVHWESDPSEMEGALREALLPVLWSAMVHLLDHFDALGRYPLHYVEYVGEEGDERVYYPMAIRGARGVWREATPRREALADEPSYRRHHLYLCSQDGRLLLDLHPILIAYNHNLYFFDCVIEEGQIQYRNCATARRWTPQKGRPTFVCSALDESGAGEGEDLVEQLQQASVELEKLEQMARPDEMPWAALRVRLSAEGRQALEIALGEGLRVGHFWLGVEFLLMGLTKQDGRPLGELLHELGESRGHFRGGLRGMVGVVTDKDWRRADVKALGAEAFERLQASDPATLAEDFAADEDGKPPPVVTPRMMQVLRDAAKMAGEGKIGHSHLLLAALRHVMCPPVNALYGLAVQRGWNPGDVPVWVAQQGRVQGPKLDPLGLEGEKPGEGAVARPGQMEEVQPPLRVRGVLVTYGRDLTELARGGVLRPAVGEGAHKAMVQMGLILQQTQANNPVLLGDPGVGKTAIVEGFAWRLAVGAEHGQPVVPELASKRIVDLPPAALLAGTKYRGELEERLQKLVAEVRAARGEVIVFIDEMHTILGGRAEGGLGAIADALKPALARGEFPCIGATTVSEYRRYVEADPALARRFTPVWVEEPTEEEAIEIVAQVAAQYLGPSHGVRYSQEVVEEAVRLGVRYVHDEFLPGKAIKILDQAGPRVILGGSLRGAGEVDKDQTVGGMVTVEMVREIVSERTGVPLTRLSEDDSQKLLGLEERLRRRVKGQDEAVAQVTRVVKRARAGLADPRRPLGVFLFAGPTGVGKTELALALAEALFDEEEAILRLDMSEYMEQHQVSRLIGAPPGYKGYEDEGQLTGRLRRQPYSVVLLDEIEKAHKEVQHLFLQLFDAGRLTDARGNLADGRNAIFIMTTNLGAKVPLGFAKPQMGSFTQQMKRAIEDHFTPEFLNRIDRIVYFAPLDKEVLLRIFDREFESVAKRLREQGIEVEVTEPFKRYLCEKHTDLTRGARPLQRAIEDEIVTPLTDKLLAGEIKPGMKVTVGEGGVIEISGTAISSSEDVVPPRKVPNDEPMGGLLPGRGLMGARAPQVEAPDTRDEELARNQARFEAVWAPVAERLRERGVEVEVDEGAREFLCDPFWTETSLEEAVVELVEKPLVTKLEAGEFGSGDRVRVQKYADHLEFKKLDAD